MIDSFYNLLASLGFTHPLHPMLVHMPMGLVFGAVFFSLADFKWPGKHFNQSAYHCSLLALISIAIVYPAGLLDWQYVFNGEWSIWIRIKMVLGVVLAVVLAYSVMAKHKGASRNKLSGIYLFALALCGGLGFSGGQLLYGG